MVKKIVRGNKTRRQEQRELVNSEVGPVFSNSNIKSDFGRKQILSIKPN